MSETSVDENFERAVPPSERFEPVIDLLKEAEDTEAIRTSLLQSLKGDVRSAEDYFAEFELIHGR